MYRMKYISVLLLLTVIHGITCAQVQHSARIDKVRMAVRNGKVYVTYDLLDEDADRKHDIGLKFLSDKHELISPRSLSGDFGPDITAGRERTIIWDINSDIKTIPGRVSPIIVLDLNLYDSRYTGGPENAWFSVLMPGLGDYKVANPQEMKFPPYLRTAVSWGFIGLGIIASVQRSSAVGHYETYIPQYGWYGQNLSYDASLKTRYVEGPTKYWLFRGDSEVFIAAGVMVWIYDILWVSSRGKSNQRLIKSLENQQLSLMPMQKGIGLSYRVTF